MKFMIKLMIKSFDARRLWNGVFMAAREESAKQPGVFPASRKDGSTYFRSSLTCRGKHISLGSFSACEEAASAYQEGKRLLTDTALSIHDYTAASPLPFEKWVSLINFRDNNIYFGTPIYVGKRLFYYYLSPSKILKFDMDDLFYYASHKIMCRGNHYFVADYGLQISISSRYGIRPYAVAGRDFRFLNGDSTDFRRENLSILNPYHGVCQETKNGQHLYAVRIHLRGNFLVGRYADETEAAIAYNKAIDICLKKGVRRQFIPNYIEGLSPNRYAEIYTRISISDKLLNYLDTTFPSNQ